MFEDLNKSIREGQERWKKIEDLVKIMKESAVGGQLHNDATHQLLLLLVDHMRPMNPSQGQLDDATKGLGDLLKALKK